MRERPRSSIDQHVARHADKVKAYNSRQGDDALLRADLLSYYSANPDERMGNCTPEEMVFRYRTVEAFLSSGTPLSVCDIFRPLLERSGIALTAREHLTLYIPKIESAEIELVIKELFEQYIALAFDGTTRLGEAVNITGRWCSADFYLRLRLLDFTTLAKSCCPCPAPPLPPGGLCVLLDAGT